MQFLKGLIAIVCAVISVAAVQAGAYANGKSKPTPRPSPKSTQPQIKVTTTEGKAEGNFSFLTRSARKGGPREQDWVGSRSGNKKISEKERREALLECFARINDVTCLDDDPTLQDPWPLTGPVARAMAVNLVASLRFPAPKPIFSPDPNNNEWKMLAVGFPVWLSTEGATTVSTSASSQGFTFRMTARWRSTTFQMGDGNAVTCTSMAKYSASVKPGTPSPNCGHVYTKPSLPKGSYQVRAVADWEVAWSVAGLSGVVPASNEATASIPIEELVALNR